MSFSLRTKTFVSLSQVLYFVNGKFCHKLSVGQKKERKFPQNFLKVCHCTDFEFDLWPQTGDFCFWPYTIGNFYYICRHVVSRLRATLGNLIIFYQYLKICNYSSLFPFLQVLQHVRLPLLNPKFLVGTVSTDLLIRSDEACRDLVDEAKNYLLLPQERPLMQGPRTRPRKPIRCGEVLFAGR